MEERNTFRRRVSSLLADIDPDVLAYDEEDYLVVRSVYEALAFFAEQNRLLNMAIALPLARGLHDGVHRKSKAVRSGKEVRLPYVIHPMTVCRMLCDMRPPLPAEELDILLAAALCHDMVEDIPFAEAGRELYTRYHLDPRVYETVKKVTKRKDFTPGEETAHFQAIGADPLALLIKLSDRGNNVEDLYNMKLAKIHEYAEETRTRILPLCSSGREDYPALRESIEVLEDKISVLVEAAVTLADRYEGRIRRLEELRDSLAAENDALRGRLAAMWQGEAPA